jgi:hypothetical protein
VGSLPPAERTLLDDAARLLLELAPKI